MTYTETFREKPAASLKVNTRSIKTAGFPED
jgi:hypothetical protein